MADQQSADINKFDSDGNNALTLATDGETVERICKMTPDLFARLSPKHLSPLEFYYDLALKQGNGDPITEDKLAAIYPYILKCLIKLRQAEAIISGVLGSSTRMLMPRPEPDDDRKRRTHYGLFEHWSDDEYEDSDPDADEEMDGVISFEPDEGPAPPDTEADADADILLCD